MTTVYHRNSYKDESMEATKEHVIQTLSSMCSDTDDPDEFRAEIEVDFSHGTNSRGEGFIRLTGTIEREPTQYERPEGYEEPPRNAAQRGFGERLMTPAELQEHLIAKEEAK